MAELKIPELPEGYFFEVGDYVPYSSLDYWCPPSPNDFPCPIVYLKHRVVTKRIIWNKTEVFTRDSQKLKQKKKGTTKGMTHTWESQELTPENIQTAMKLLKSRLEEREALKERKDALHGEYPPKRLRD